MTDQPKAQRCKHGMITATCANCNPPRVARAPQRSSRATVHAAGAVGPSTLNGIGFAIVHVNQGKDQTCRHGMDHLGSTTKIVHINGTPFLWAFEEILRRAPNLQVIQLIPTMVLRLHPDSHLRLCRERGVEVRAGHARPELAWADDRVGASKQYDAQRHFLLRLDGPQRALFEELVAMGFEAAEMVKRYYRLADEDVQVTQAELAREYGMPASNHHHVSALMLGVLHYLDPTMEVGHISQVRARGMRGRVERLRGYIASTEQRQRLIGELGLPALPEGMPLARVETLRALLAAQKDGRLDALRRKDPRACEALIPRFDLDHHCTTYRTLEQVGVLIGGVTRERARQLEERALEALGIVES